MPMTNSSLSKCCGVGPFKKALIMKEEGFKFLLGFYKIKTQGNPVQMPCMRFAEIYVGSRKTVTKFKREH